MRAIFLISCYVICYYLEREGLFLLGNYKVAYLPLALHVLTFLFVVSHHSFIWMISVKFSGLLCDKEIMLLPKENAYWVCLLGSDLPILFWEGQNLIVFFQKATCPWLIILFLTCTGSNGFVLPSNFWNCWTEDDNLAAQIPGWPWGSSWWALSAGHAEQARTGLQKFWCERRQLGPGGSLPVISGSAQSLQSTTYWS